MQQAHNGQARAHGGRDATLKRIARVRRTTIVGAGGLTVGLAAFVSGIAPGHSLGAKLHSRAVSGRTTPVTSAASSSSAPRMPALASPGQLGLQSPDGAPQPAPAAPAAPAQQSQPAPAPQAAVSGGS